ncbi:thioredoxin family protein [candidate division KSB1 bacterium]
MKKTGILISLFAVVSFCVFSSCGNKTEQSVNNGIPKPVNSEMNNVSQQDEAQNPELTKQGKIIADNNGKVISITKEDFINNIWDYQKNPDSFLYKGEIPCIVDFYADWCRPCKIVAPIMEELAQDYKGKINIYKVNTDLEKELAQVFRIQGIPSMLFVPAEGLPQMTSGAFAKNEYVNIINDVIFAQK